MDPDERRLRVNADPETYFITDHYRNHPLVLVRLTNIGRTELRRIVEDAWRLSAPKRKTR
jgi:hypothetical protein